MRHPVTWLAATTELLSHKKFSRLKSAKVQVVPCYHLRRSNQLANLWETKTNLQVQEITKSVRKKCPKIHRVGLWNRVFSKYHHRLNRPAWGRMAYKWTKCRGMEATIQLAIMRCLILINCKAWQLQIRFSEVIKATHQQMKDLAKSRLKRTSS